ncbi:MAG: glyoxalase/bleomycin resistance protein/dioxygenase superfamily protein [Sphingomonas bacterium]|nr:VOC family protein [Sphingomonas bacterium]MDB5690539.1 glyoxalase/bleomycin resistance protein/dioxygenase superfamily protein [Sphingomonas bacterium]
MPGLDHVNLQTTRLAETVAFYRDVIGLEVRDPPGLDPKLVQWMHDESGHGILHLSTVGSLLGEAPADLQGGGTGAVHHVALDCTGHDAMIATLEANRLPYRLNHVGVIDLKQIFVSDPNGVLLELNYRAGQH